MTRDPDRPALDPWRTTVEVIEANALIPATLAAALDGRDVAYYLLPLPTASAGGSAARDRGAAVTGRGHRMGVRAGR